jgi:hypothetical protein
MNTGRQVKYIPRNYTDAINSATSGRFVIKQTTLPQTKKLSSYSPRTIPYRKRVQIASGYAAFTPK